MYLQDSRIADGSQTAERDAAIADLDSSHQRAEVLEALTAAYKEAHWRASSTAMREAAALHPEASPGRLTVLAGALSLSRALRAVARMAEQRAEQALASGGL